MDKDDVREQNARIRVRKIRQFYTNLITFVLVNILLVMINLFLSPHDLWFYWVTIIWGVVLLIQAINTFTIRDQFLGNEWEEKKVKEMLEKDKSKENPHQDNEDKH